MTNMLIYGDNLDILRNRPDLIPTASVDLIYLDPPFNSSRTYNVLFKNESGAESGAQIEAFEDTWHWHHEADATYRYLVTQTTDDISKVIAAMYSFIGPNQMMAYIVMMTVRLIELHRVLKPTGSLYLHCDPTASHYLKVVLDTIFGAENFRNEIVWKRSDSHNDAKQGSKRYGRVHDIIFFYTRGNEWTWNTLYTPLPESTRETWYRNVEESTGRRYNKADLTAAKAGGDTRYEWHGVLPPPGRFWAYSRENMEQLEREGRIAYSESGRPYMKRYLDESLGVPIQDWWGDIEMLRGITRSNGGTERLGYPTQKPLGGHVGQRDGKKGSDKGIDGVIVFLDDNSGQPKRAIVQVKSGHVTSALIRDLRGTVEREKAAIGVFVTLEAPSADMTKEAITAGVYHSDGWNRDYPTIQILTVADLLKAHAVVQLPPELRTFKEPQRVKPDTTHAQASLFVAGGGDVEDDDGDEDDLADAAE